METSHKCLVQKVPLFVILFTIAVPFLPAQDSNEPKSQSHEHWNAPIMIKFKGDVTVDRNNFITAWPYSVDMAVIVKSAPNAKEDKIFGIPTTTGWLLPLSPATELRPTKTRVRLKPSKEVKTGWEFKGAILITPKDVATGHYPVDVVFEIGDTGPGYHMEIRGFKSGPGFTLQATPALFAPGAEHQIVGKVQFANIVITGDETYPLTFRFTQTGYEYLYGRGSMKVGARKEELSFGEKDSVDYWTSLVSSTEDRVREAAAAALGYLPTIESEKEAALYSLLKLAKDPVANVRRNATESLGRLKDERAQNILEEMLRTEKDEWVRKVTLWAKKQIQK